MKIIPFRRGVLADVVCEAEVEVGREVSPDLKSIEQIILRNVTVNVLKLT
jgi:hypothetical protein